MRAMAPGSQTMIRKAVSIQALSVEAVGPGVTGVDTRRMVDVSRARRQAGWLRSGPATASPSGDAGVTIRGSGAGSRENPGMREKLVCIKCWRWYEDRTTCPTCKTPLIHADSGRPVTEMQAPPPPPPRTRATPTYYPHGVMPPAPGAPGGYPSVSGYPAGSPVAPPSAFTTPASIGRPRMVSTEPRATAKSWAPLAPQPVADFAFFSGASDPPPPP